MRPRLELSPYRYVALLLVVFWGVILFTMFSGIWTSKVSVVSERVSAEQVSTEIKGWMTFLEVSKHTQVSLQDLHALAKVPDSLSPDTTLKDAAGQYGFSVDDFKTALRAFMEKH
jgi:hypothetical protein